MHFYAVRHCFVRFWYFGGGTQTKLLAKLIVAREFSVDGDLCSTLALPRTHIHCHLKDFISDLNECSISFLI